MGRAGPRKTAQWRHAQRAAQPDPQRRNAANRGRAWESRGAAELPHPGYARFAARRFVGASSASVFADCCAPCCSVH